MKKVHWVHQGAAHGKAFRMHPLKLIGIIFSGIGLLFAVLGGTFLLCNTELLPRLFTAEVWADSELPDELALPMCGLIFGAMGLIFLVIGVVMLLVMHRQRLLREELERYGVRVTGTVTDITIDRSYRVNGRSPLRVHVTAVHPTTGEAVTVRSGPVWETNLSTGDTADVLFDPMDERKRIVLLSE